MNLRESSPTEAVILGFDPGRDKCGLAVIGIDRQLHYHEVVAANEAIATIEKLRQRFAVSLMVMGDQTTAKQWKKRLNQELAEPLNIALVDERYSTLEARDRYWQMYPPKGLTKLLPQGMRQPPRPIDDIVAILLIERYLNRLVESVNN
ncbi:pre-16S rRNA-processing nuclease YqgF [Calothrix sp. FACHB-1219]|uniref:pre-16S rRNA-processing nuclease YqgF n=1 Tax=unclassified Calothrix TaxID=2619626 RepID=UPI0016874DB7|nr:MULTISPECIES: pre-16S rRNA-processing nuclease YqgF [unclassified Calothrix]MBD2203751.1 pre-16S rRNA-processing nuclease YqgF [Calothrix sp. FACHB-168]MBD2219571.1 pre-16S rRNA-processing nuclease YqgF [Calothrix sp. FACHB-1219]